MDLSQEATWAYYESQLASFDAVFLAPDCKTFCPARRFPGGPELLRTKDRPLGLPKWSLSEGDHKKVKTHNFFAIKSAKFVEACATLGKPVLLENPEPWEPSTATIWDLEEFKSLLARRSAVIIDFDQCMFGAETAKPTRLMGFNVAAPVPSVRCNHTPRYWNYTDHRGNSAWHWGPHPPLVNRSRGGEFATAAAAVYPPKLNAALAAALSGSSS